MSCAALVRLPRDLMRASRRIRFSFCSTDSVEEEAAPCCPAAGPDAGAPRNLGSRSNSVSLPPLRRTTAFSQKLRSSRMFPGHAYACSVLMAPGSISIGGTPFSAERLLMK